MKDYKVNVYLNRIPPNYDIMSDFEIARLYYLKHGVNITWNFNNVSVFGYASQLNVILNRWLVDGAEKLVKIDPIYDATIFAFDQAEWSTPPGSPFPLKPNTPNGFCSIQKTPKPFITIGSYIVDHNNGQTAIQIAHELMHSLVQNALIQNMPFSDVMDTYFENTLEDLPNSNFMQQWKLLQPFINLKKTLQAVLTRNSDDGVQTLGTLVYGDFKCQTLERPWKENQSNISCIPKGTYQVKYTFSLKFLKYTYEILNVSGRSGIRIHSANYFYDLLGCIGLGSGYTNLNNDKEVDIINSRVTIKAFEQLMGKKDFTLIIQ